jgi:hypothetical protein
MMELFSSIYPEDGRELQQTFTRRASNEEVAQLCEQLRSGLIQRWRAPEEGPADENASAGDDGIPISPRLVL